MTLSVPDITVSSADWVDLYAVTGIPAGTSIRIQNKSIRAVQMLLTTTKPNLLDQTGEIITSVQSPYAEQEIFGANNIWLKAVNLAATLSVVRDIPTPGSSSGGGTTNGLTDTQLRASAVPVTTDGLTNAQLRASAVPVSGPLTDAQLRASAVPVTTDGLTNAQLRASAVPVTTDGLTNAQLRASAVPISGAVTTDALTNAQLRATAVTITGALTNADLRAVDVNVKPVMSTGGNLSITLNTDAATYVAFGGVNARQFTIANNTGTTIEFLQAATGVSFPIFDGSYYTIFGITNTSQISVRRADGVTGAAALTVKARWET